MCRTEISLHEKGERERAMKTRYVWLLKTCRDAGLVTGISFLISSAAFAQAPDNSKTNQQGRDKGAVTADQQAETQADRDLAKKIRKSIINDKSLSTYAHNVKIIARSGTVVLKGPVRTEDEKTAIEVKATEIAGANNVRNELTVKAKSEN
jgi:hyperosmotically inducible protein